MLSESSSLCASYPDKSPKSKLGLGQVCFTLRTPDICHLSSEGKLCVLTELLKTVLMGLSTVLNKTLFLVWDGGLSTLCRLALTTLAQPSSYLYLQESGMTSSMYHWVWLHVEGAHAVETWEDSWRQVLDLEWDNLVGDFTLLAPQACRHSLTAHPRCHIVPNDGDQEYKTDKREWFTELALTSTNLYEPYIPGRKLWFTNSLSYNIFYGSRKQT